jgi:hypothetical protein
MNTPRSMPASSDAPSYARIPFSQHTRPLKTVRACTPSPNPGPMADWWARHTSGAARPSVGEALTTRTDEEVIGDTVSAFRTALRRTDGVESPADLQSDGATETGNDAPADSLDYFAPAFRRALGREERRADTHAVETKADSARAAAGADEATPAASLDYFTPALPSASGQGDPSDALSGAFATLGEEAGPDTEETDAAERSLDYFAPAFRRALGRRQHADPESPEARVQEEEPQGAVEQLKEAIEGMSERGIERFSGEERPEETELSLDLARLAERLFTGPPRGCASLNGG